MSDIIKILPIDVSNKIAAGEVVQRPSSVLKELIENSIDANSTRIKIIIKDAGKNLIQVIDNGKGMSRNDMHLSFIKHATSKISKMEDIFSISSKYFENIPVGFIPGINISLSPLIKSVISANSFFKDLFFKISLIISIFII